MNLEGVKKKFGVLTMISIHVYLSNIGYITNINYVFI